MLWTVFFAIAGLSFGQAKLRVSLSSTSTCIRILANLKSWGEPGYRGKAPHLSKSSQQTLSMMSRYNIVLGMRAATSIP